MEVDFGRGITTRVKDLMMKLKEKRKRKEGRGYLEGVDLCDRHDKEMVVGTKKRVVITVITLKVSKLGNSTWSQLPDRSA